MKKIHIFLLVLLIFITAAAVRADDLSDVTQNGVLRVGSSPEYVPFVLGWTADGCYCPDRRYCL